VYKHILLPVDGSELSIKAAEECLAFAQATGARVTALNVVSSPGIVLEEAMTSGLVQKLEKSFREVAVEQAEKMLARLVEAAKAKGVPCESRVVVGDHPYREIIDAAGRFQCDLIMMASHGRRGLEGLVLGSETVKVLTHCSVPVLVVRQGTPE
jgi:nucleotide-binding universal stress UspA family protein